MTIGDDEMATKQSGKTDALTGRDRRSSVRVRSRLPCAIEAIEKQEIPTQEARILDTAVLESEGVMHDAVDWRDHAEDLSREMVFVLNEIRALRQQLTEVQRLMERHNQTALQHRWIELNDQGLWLPSGETDEDWSDGDYAAVRIKIPSIQTPEVLAVAQVLRVDGEGDRRGAAFEFCSISQPHQRAISRYALRRERQMARSQRLDIDFE